MEIKTFKFANRDVYVDFKNQKVTTNANSSLYGDEEATFAEVLAIFNCIENNTQRCAQKFGGYQLIIHDYDWGNRRIQFGCQTGTYAEVKEIVDCIKRGSRRKWYYLWIK